MAASPSPSKAASASSGGAGAELSVEKLKVEAVNASAHRENYKAREPIYPKSVHGVFRRLKWLVLALTLGVYYLLPWVRWPRAPHEPSQAILVDFAGSRFYFFFIEIWSDELYYVTGLLIIASLALFLATALFGRVWCGYACPQTVWTDLFVAVERLVEGDRNKQIRLAKAPWTADKIRKKVVKHTLWLLIGMATGGAWILYFHDAPTLARDFFRGAAPFSAYFYCALLTFTTYIFAGSMREQVCTYMCPWPRIQAALTDEETLQVTYKVDRGEPRGAHKKGDTWDDRGDCVSCRACVAACPMGIDIRDGAQLECINCALCIDACDDIMGKVGRPLGLIGYDTDANVVRRETGQKQTFKFFRPRTVLYGTVLALVGSLMLFGLITRPTLGINVLRDRTPPFVMLSDGSVRNAYTVKIVNRGSVERDFKIEVAGPDAIVWTSLGDEISAEEPVLAVAPDDIRSLRLFLTAPANAFREATTPITFTVSDVETGEAADNPSVFLSRG